MCAAVFVFPSFLRHVSATNAFYERAPSNNLLPPSPRSRRGRRPPGAAIQFRGEDITDWSAEMRGKSGIFLAFQYPHEVAGVSVINFLRQALSARKDMQMSVLELRLSIMEWLERLNMDPSFAERYLNEGFSGGEKKRNEILQMAILEPEVAILDETDSGLDIDALGVVADGVAKVREKNSDLGVLTITHYQRLLEYLNPDLVHVIMDGRIVATGGNEIVEKLESSGYESFRNGDS